MKKIRTYTVIIAAVLALSMLIPACAGKDKGQKFFSIDELKAPGTTISMWQGCGYESYVEEAFPDANRVYGSYVPDLALNVRQDKADALVLGETFYNYFHDDLSDIVVLEGNIGEINSAAIFSESGTGKSLLTNFNTWLVTATNNGTISELREKWLGPDSQDADVDYSNLDENNLHIRVGAASDEPPYAFIKGDHLVGFDVETIMRFCEDYKYYPEFTADDYDAMVTAIQVDKYDLIVAGYEISEEREESVTYSNPLNTSRVIVGVKGEAEKVSFIDSVKKSFKRTFIDDDRYMQFIDGIKTTFILTFGSVLLGTILGFGIYLLYRDGGKAVRKIFDILSVLTHRIPALVLLMVIYYIIFADVAIEPVLVAIILFTLLFALSTFEALSLSVGAVGKGQVEAAFTLGFTKNETFFKILLPQGMPIFLSNYKDAIVSTLLESSVVGYITIVDLTRVGDIIRNNTYEAFFPLIAVALFYLFLSTAIIALVNIIERKINPENRTQKQVLMAVLGNEIDQVEK